MDTKADTEVANKCSSDRIVALNDAMNVISGKWKLPIIATLIHGKKRFKELEREIPNITARMLSKELRDLELNDIVSRTVHATVPVTVEYALTPSGTTLIDLLEVMIQWGFQHRQDVLGK